MSILFLGNSLLTTIQDLGRTGFRDLGVNPNGVMDRKAIRLINILLGNDENEAVLEIHFPAPKIFFEEDAVISLGGADFGAEIEKIGLKNWQVIFVRKGQTLSFTEKNSGERVYLSAKGGFQIDEWMNSKSTNLIAERGGYNGRRLLKNDRIRLNLRCPDPQRSFQISPYFAAEYLCSNKIRFIAGAEFDLLTPFSSEVLLKEPFTISQDSDRMGYRLDGKRLFLLHEKELISSAVTFGTIQCVPSGQLIILMADHQTTGGYPRIGHAVSVDLPILAQLGVNDKITFDLVSLETAETLALEFERDLNLLRTAINLNAFN